MFTSTNCNLTYLRFLGLRIACSGCRCLPGLAAVSEITIRHTLKGVFHLRRCTRCLLPFLGFTYWQEEKMFISKQLWPKNILAKSHHSLPAELLSISLPTFSWYSGFSSHWLTTAQVLHSSFPYSFLGFPLHSNVFFPETKYTVGFLMTDKYLWHFFFLFLTIIFPTFGIIEHLPGKSCRISLPQKHLQFTKNEIEK